MRRIVNYCLVATALTCAGCGLGDYEARMELQQKKLKYAEEQNQNLEGFKVMLADRKPEDDVVKEDFFFRPPKGFDGNGDEKTIGADIVHFNVIKEGAFKDLWIAAVKRDNEAKFQKDVLELLKINSKTKKPKTVGGVGLTQLNYDWVHDDQGSRGCYDAYFYKKAPYLVAIVFKTESSRDGSNGPPQIDYALASMRVGQDARGQKVLKTPAATAPTKTGKTGNK